MYVLVTKVFGTKKSITALRGRPDIMGFFVRIIKVKATLKLVICFLLRLS